MRRICLTSTRGCPCCAASAWRHKRYTKSFTDLRDRELEVLRLIADGLSNSEIASKLVISEKAAKGHVSNILDKLHMMNRMQAAAYAWQQGLVARLDP